MPYHDRWVVFCWFRSTGAVGMNRYERHTYQLSLSAARQALADAESHRLPPSRLLTFWRTRDGQRIAVAHMTAEHLLNTIRYCERTGFRKNKVGLLRIEARRRGLTTP